MSSQCVHCRSTNTTEVPEQSTATHTAHRCGSCNRMFTVPTLLGKNPWVINLASAAMIGGIGLLTGGLLQGHHGHHDGASWDPFGPQGFSS